MKTIKIILIFLLLPVICRAEIGLSPAKISFEQKNFKAGETYFLNPNLQISNSDSVEHSVVMSVECWSEKPCIDKSWITFNPQKFTLIPNSVQEVQVSFKAPRDISPKLYDKYEIILQATLDKSPTGFIEGVGASLSYALGTKIDFHLSGKVSFGKAIGYWLQDKIGNRVLASLARLNIDGFSTLIVSSVILGIFLSFFLLKKLFRRNKSGRKPKQEFQPELRPRLSDNILDLRGVKSKRGLER